MRILVFASHNAGKILELESIFADTDIKLISQKELGIEAVPETGVSFVENALIKARHVASQVQYPVIADDSGLIVDALDGAPGVISARYAGDDATDHDNRIKLIQELKNKNLESASARIVSVMVAIKNPDDPMPIIGQGTWEGQVIDECRGQGGFGYCPMFYLPEFKCTIAEMDDYIKNTSSHRYLAVKEMMPYLNKLFK